jgi:hypothetical protein
MGSTAIKQVMSGNFAVTALYAGAIKVWPSGMTDPVNIIEVTVQNLATLFPGNDDIPFLEVSYYDNLGPEGSADNAIEFVYNGNTHQFNNDPTPYITYNTWSNVWQLYIPRQAVANGEFHMTINTKGGIEGLKFTPKFHMNNNDRVYDTGTIKDIHKVYCPEITYANQMFYFQQYADGIVDIAALTGDDGIYLPKATTIAEMFAYSDIAEPLDGLFKSVANLRLRDRWFDDVSGKTPQFNNLTRAPFGSTYGLFRGTRKLGRVNGRLFLEAPNAPTFPNGNWDYYTFGSGGSTDHSLMDAGTINFALMFESSGITSISNDAFRRADGTSIKTGGSYTDSAQHTDRYSAYAMFYRCPELVSVGNFFGEQPFLQYANRLCYACTKLRRFDGVYDVTQPMDPDNVVFKNCTGLNSIVQAFNACNQLYNKHYPYNAQMPTGMLTACAGSLNNASSLFNAIKYMHNDMNNIFSGSFYPNMTSNSMTWVFGFGWNEIDGAIIAVDVAESDGPFHGNMIYGDEILLKTKFNSGVIEGSQYKLGNGRVYSPSCVTNVSITDFGTGYEDGIAKIKTQGVTPSVLAIGTCTVDSSGVTSVDITDSGNGYLDKCVVSFAPTSGAPVTTVSYGVVNCTGDGLRPVTTVEVITPGEGYINGDPVHLVTYDDVPVVRLTTDNGTIIGMDVLYYGDMVQGGSNVDIIQDQNTSAKCNVSVGNVPERGTQEYGGQILKYLGTVSDASLISEVGYRRLRQYITS